jgi:HAD superfamily hydrolase (TIGR01549 family)
MATSFDLFGTLVSTERPDAPWAAVADELAMRDITVPADGEAAYRETHRSCQPGREISLVVHTIETLRSRGIQASRDTVHEALLAAFDGPVEQRTGAPEALAAAADAGSIGILSNCSLPGLVEQTLERAAFDVSFDAVVTSVACGWRKPHDGAFRAVANALGVEPVELFHVGDDRRADGGGRSCGVSVVLTEDVPLAAFPEWLERHSGTRSR